MYRDNPEIAKKYKSKRWQKLRNQKLILNPFCERCQIKGIYNTVDIIHHKDYVTDLNYENDEVFFNIENLESLCLDCHNRGTFWK